MTLLSQMGIAALLSLIVAVTPAIMGTAYAIWPSEAKLALMRPISLAGLFAGLGGFTTGMVNLFQYAASHSGPVLETSPLFAGAAESLVPLGVAFGALTIAWLLVAVGMRKRAE